MRPGARGTWGGASRAVPCTCGHTCMHTHGDTCTHRHTCIHTHTCAHVPARGLSSDKASLRQVPRVCAPVPIQPASEEEPLLLPPCHLGHRVALLLPPESQEHRCARVGNWARQAGFEGSSVVRQCTGCSPARFQHSVAVRSGTSPVRLGRVGAPPLGALGLVRKYRPVVGRRPCPTPVRSLAFPPGVPVPVPHSSIQQAPGRSAAWAGLCP